MQMHFSLCHCILNNCTLLIPNIAKDIIENWEDWPWSWSLSEYPVHAVFAYFFKIAIDMPQFVTEQKY